MAPGDKFFIILLITVLVVRVFLYAHPTPGVTINGWRVHHYAYGVIGVPVAIVTGSLPLLALSLGFFEDELTYQMINGKNHRDNYSPISLFGTAMFLVLTYLLRNNIVKLVF